MVETRAESVLSSASAGVGPSNQLTDNSDSTQLNIPPSSDDIPAAPSEHATKAVWQQYGQQMRDYATRQQARQTQQSMQLRAERDVAIRQLAVQATVGRGATADTDSEKKKPIIKTQGKEPATYYGGSFIQFDNYVIEVEQQFVMNNVHDRKDMDSQKISYAVSFLRDTPKLSWLAAIRAGTVESNWEAFKTFLKVQSQDSATFAKDTYSRWQAAEQRPGQKASEFIAYLDRQASYLPDDLRPNEKMQMQRLSLSLERELQASLATETPYPTTYEAMKERVLILEENLRARQNILRKPGAESHARKRARQFKHGSDDGEEDDNNAPRYSNRGRGSRGYNGRSQRGRGGRGYSRGRNGQNGGEQRGRHADAGNNPATGANSTKRNDSAKREHDQRQSKGQCFTCGSTDHWAKDCPQQSKNT